METFQIHTPGPWTITRIGGDRYISHLEQDNQKIVKISHICKIPDSWIHREDEKEANARLIASAPALLEAAFKGREACQILADECMAEGKPQCAAIWQKKVDICNQAIKQANN